MLTESPAKILRKPQVLERVNVSSTTLWRLERRGEFPKHVRISPGAVGYFEADVDAWIRSRPRPSAEGGR